MKTTPKYHWIAALFVLASSAALAGPVGTLNTFTAGTAASAAQVNSNFDTVKAAVNDNAARITPLETTVSSNSTSIATMGTTIAGLPRKHTGAVYRWATFSTYSQASGWYASNNPAFFGGVPPSTWTDGNGNAAQMSADKEVLRTLFTQKGYGGMNAVVYVDERYSYSSTDGKMAAALFRIKNTTANPIDWIPSINFTSYPAWGETASVALNGNLAWSSGATTLSPVSSAVAVTLSMPANRTSTAIFVSGSSPPNITRSTFLAFGNNSLALPAGLEYVDDFDTATGNWSQ